MKEIDVRGMACREPMLQTKAVLEKERCHHIKVLMGSASAQQNVCDFLKAQGYETLTEKTGDDYIVVGKIDLGSKKQSEGPVDLKAKQLKADEKKIMVMCATDRIGFGDDALGKKLMINFLRTLKEMGRELWRLVFVNNGVKLTIDESEALDTLKEYEENGLAILVCGTCLDHFDLLEKKKVGDTTNMLDIVTAMQLADTVINI
jgi:selenium metabolism protein YedF